MEDCKIGSTIFYGYFDDPSDFNPDKGVKEGVLVEDNDYDYCVTIASVKSRNFTTIPKYCCGKVESTSSLDYPDSYGSDRYFCYGLDKDKVNFQLSFKALSMINEKYSILEKQLKDLKVAKDRLQKEIGIEER